MCTFFRRKKEGREPHAHSEYVRKLHGLKLATHTYRERECVCVSKHSLLVMSCRAKLYNRKRFAEKVEMKKKYVSSMLCMSNYQSVCVCARIKLHAEKSSKKKKEEVVPDGAVPAYLLDRWAIVIPVT